MHPQRLAGGSDPVAVMKRGLTELWGNFEVWGFCGDENGDGVTYYCARHRLLGGSTRHGMIWQLRT